METVFEELNRRNSGLSNWDKEATWTAGTEPIVLAREGAYIGSSYDFKNLRLFLASKLPFHLSCSPSKPKGMILLILFLYIQGKWGEGKQNITFIKNLLLSLSLSLSKKTYYEPKSSNYWTFLDYKMVLILEQFFGEKVKTTVCYTNNCINYKIHFDLVKKKILGCTMKLRCPILWLLSSPYRSKAKLFKSPKVISVDITEDVTGEKIKRTSITHLQQTA